jgi:hypothetical protein
MKRILIPVVVSLLLSGCVRRTLHVTSDPPGALVYLNDQEVGRTPLEKDFTWYGTYDAVVRKDGYDTLKTRSKVIAPWWQWPPFDLVAELLPLRLHNEKNLHYTLTASGVAPSDDEMLGRAEQMRIQLESSEFTRKPPEAQPSTQPVSP